MMLAPLGIFLMYQGSTHYVTINVFTLSDKYIIVVEYDGLMLDGLLPPLIAPSKAQFSTPKIYTVPYLSLIPILPTDFTHLSIYPSFSSCPSQTFSLTTPAQKAPS